MKFQLLFLLLAAGLAAPAGASDAERRQIEVDRQAIQRDFAAEEAACQRRFAVTPCIEDARQRRRQALAPLRERELALDAADRQRRAQDRRQAIRAKEQAASAASAAFAAGPEVTPRVRKASGALAKELPASAPVADPARAAAAAARAQDAAQRRVEAKAVQERVARRQAERAAQGKLVHPLPVPASGAGPGEIRKPH